MSLYGQLEDANNDYGIVINRERLLKDYSSARLVRIIRILTREPMSETKNFLLSVQLVLARRYAREILDDLDRKKQLNAKKYKSFILFRLCAFILKLLGLTKGN